MHEASDPVTPPDVTMVVSSSALPSSAPSDSIPFALGRDEQRFGPQTVFPCPTSLVESPRRKKLVFVILPDPLSCLLYVPSTLSRI